ncbi:MAG: Bug family tripartite tricarboxylate transporter substrate binding protein [Beijerinckiaceae bacterium]
MITSAIRIGAACGSLLFAFMNSGAAQADDFYRGKTITMSTHTAPGGGYDMILRLLARHYARHIPGAPNILVVNQPGAGGLLSLNYAARRASQDGTWLALVSQGLILHDALGRPGLEASLKTFKWIGNLNSSNNVTATWHTSGVRTIEDAMKKDVTVGSTGAGAITSIVPAVMNSILGTRFKIISGYEGGAAQDIAMERGELDGRSVNTWDNYKSLRGDAIKTGRLHVLVQIAMKKEPDLPDVPLLVDLVKDDPAKARIARFLSLGMSASRPLAAPPGTPDAQVRTLRAAFEAAVKDLLLLADADKIGAEISPLSGEEVQLIVTEVIDAPVDVKEAFGRAAKL